MAQALVLAKDPYKGFPTYYDWLRDMYCNKRDRLLGGCSWSRSVKNEYIMQGMSESSSCRVVPLFINNLISTSPFP